MQPTRTISRSSHLNSAVRKSAGPWADFWPMSLYISSSVSLVGSHQQDSTIPTRYFKNLFLSKMKFRDIRSKLALHLRPGKQSTLLWICILMALPCLWPTGTRYPDLDVMALKTKPQTGSTLMQLPLEIRIAIFQELCDAAGLSQHIMFQDGHYVRARCVTDHAASDGLMEECARFNMTRFDDPLIWGRLMSTWGNHWKCEELYQSMKQTSWSPFLAMMLACRQL